MSKPTPDNTARNLAEELAQLLEVVANLHYLLDVQVENPESVRALRAMEDDAFSKMLALVLKHLPQTSH